MADQPPAASTNETATDETAADETPVGMDRTSSTPELLSVVVTVVDGAEILRKCLDALAGQENAPEMEVLVPYDESLATNIGALRDDYPDVQFIDMGRIDPERPITTQAGQHELFDRRRATGLGAATGDVIALIEDRGAPLQDWAASVVRVHEGGAGVIGGAVECAPSPNLNWAFYVCDFGRYGRPFESGPADWVTDINVSYKRRVLEATRHLWKDRFQEPIVHWACQEAGEELYLSSEFAVEHGRRPATLGVLLPERFHWGRLFGHIRANNMSLGKRIALTAMGPIIAPMLFVRHAMTQRRKGNFGRYLRAAPYVAILLAGWTTGEVWGYITKRP